jgi:hypothetical protein
LLIENAVSLIERLNRLASAGKLVLQICTKLSEVEDWEVFRLLFLSLVLSLAFG